MFQYSVRYRRHAIPSRIVRMTVVAANADDARRIVAFKDPDFSHTTESPKRGGRVVIEEPESADGLTASKARDDLLRGVAHFDREYVEWRGTDVEVLP